MSYMRAGAANPAKKNRIGSVPSRISSNRGNGSYREASGVAGKPGEK
jgi:hypothetical protein